MPLNPRRELRPCAWIPIYHTKCPLLAQSRHCLQTPARGAVKSLQPLRSHTGGTLERTQIDTFVVPRADYNLAKVGVVGSNPIARSNSSHMAKVVEDGGF
jgi:hypothetical protein